MQQPAKVTAVYRELRQALGLKATAGEILACAASLVELFSFDDGMPAYELREGRQPNDMMAVDVALADGGWRTLSREWDQMGWETSDSCGGKRPGDWLMA